MTADDHTLEWTSPDVAPTEVLPRARGRHRLRDGITDGRSLVEAIAAGMGILLLGGLVWLVNPFASRPVITTAPSPAPVTHTTIPAVYLPLGSPTPTPTPTHRRSQPLPSPPLSTHRVTRHPTPSTSRS